IRVALHRITNIRLSFCIEFWAPHITGVYRQPNRHSLTSGRRKLWARLQSLGQMYSKAQRRLDPSGKPGMANIVFMGINTKDGIHSCKRSVTTTRPG
ncbi:hypothetical protein AWZ03_015313, partial [Drosophila navojoa]